MILVDTNVLLDLVTDDPVWAAWSQQQLDLRQPKTSSQSTTSSMPSCRSGIGEIEQLDAMIAAAGLVNAVIPRPALFLAGKAFQRYRSAGGRKTGVLPDFFIGAHAVVADTMLITRDAVRYRSYFPGIMLMAPN